MAHSPSPSISAVGSHKMDRMRSPTPPPQPLSKRDKRRSLLSERLNELTAAFAQNRDTHYRQQLQALQVDMNLIMRANPYSEAPLDDMGDDIAEVVSAALGGGSNGQWRLDGDAAALSGRWYSKFTDEVNDAMEDRDANLTMLEHRYERTIADLNQVTQYKVRLAQEEHRQLSHTVRERLTQTVGQKKNRLVREKEHLDIADSNALLLHPNQFSITNPASPGGAHSNRKTRHTRNRQGEGDDLGNIIGEAGNKRKRKVFEEFDVGSPVPGKTFETGIASPYRDAKTKLTATQMEAPLYSIERLFTEKELSMHLNTAAIAAAQYFASLKAQGENNGDKANGEAEPSEGEEGGAGEGGIANKEGDFSERASPFVAPAMDRAANQSFHATRSTRNTAGPAGLNILGDLASSERNGNNASFPSSFPVFLPSSVITKTGVAPPPPPLRPEDAEDDLVRIQRLVSTAPPEHVDKRLLDSLCAPLGTAQHRTELFPALAQAAVNGTATAAVAATHAAVPQHVLAGAEPMSRQSSGAGFSDVGGVPMSRHGEGSSMGMGISLGLGPSMMKRSASGAGFTSGGEGGKRSRNR
ncbi:hypothetical protein L228DRAFT_280542 [Xylona heveae TC161]|uniref:Deacetylase complex subunit Sds3 n=1 Tax=Xylona heveae (strain CBS 132557 / TC161) TaxID=1328760 RepID=A0A165IRR0_XYLHT|nr:hypothetical protein L228DRAFT_280542 [Xylona heveae TC161]KZF25290.1 hypothetical protein L228DRAFT_280542 [Xylona heveae TC161]